MQTSVRCVGAAESYWNISFRRDCHARDVRTHERGHPSMTRSGPLCVGKFDRGTRRKSQGPENTANTRQDSYRTLHFALPLWWARTSWESCVSSININSSVQRVSQDSLARCGGSTKQSVRYISVLSVICNEFARPRFPSERPGFWS